MHKTNCVFRWYKRRQHMALKVTSLTQQNLEISTYSLCKELPRTQKSLSGRPQLQLKSFIASQPSTALTVAPISQQITGWEADWTSSCSLLKTIQVWGTRKEECAIEAHGWSEQCSRKRSEDSSSVTSSNLNTLSYPKERLPPILH